MLDSPAKRQKTSASNTADALLATSTNASRTRDFDAPSLRHASYLSPTKASLPRFIPGLRPKSPLNPQSGRTLDAGSKVPPDGAHVGDSNGTGFQHGKAKRGLFGLNGRPKSLSQNDEPRALDFKSISSAGFSAAPRRSSRFSGRFSSPIREERGHGGASSTAETSDNVHASQRARLEGVASIGRENEEAHEDAEPDLPPTPTDRNDPAAARPKGLFNSPSRRRLRKQLSRSTSPAKQHIQARAGDEGGKHHEDGEIEAPPSAAGNTINPENCAVDLFL
ncbi:hypothetical protein L228DRAFT_136237 [Xylona heveae TC161]|uniref:Uncharacterized protein n=1 Tax=Xylona heveae (strain CBS 132557 / TC161) TaxID=1328760 RepID=A0A165GZJ8_XYLHT|nr:hypothetical protein L228DRAFT_136237 [Xylona heveae TC161]KZF22798.1 hypothetical protein L228DRAFT_136237 [Xylona heveae TC161]